MIRKFIASCLLFGSFIIALTAGPPFTTDDSETPRRHGWEINLPFILGRSRALTQAQIPLFDLNYGLSDNFQLDLEVPVYRVSQPGQPPASGLGDIMFGVKWRFLEETKTRPQVAIYPQVCFATGNAARGLGAGATCYVFPVAAEKNWGKWTAYANVGYIVQTAAGNRNSFYYGATVTREVAKGLEVGAEVFGNWVPVSGDSTEDGINLGAELQVSRSIVLLASAGHTFRRDGYFMAYVGIQVLTGPNRRTRS